MPVLNPPIFVLYFILISTRTILCQTLLETAAEKECLKKCGQMEPTFQPSTRVIGGHEASKSNFPWVVNIEGIFKCGEKGTPETIRSTGVIINEHYVLTTAHSMHFPTKVIKESCPIMESLFNDFVEPFAPAWMKFKPNQLKVYAGAPSLTLFMTGALQVSEVESITFPTGYVMLGMDRMNVNDLALLKLRTPLEIGSDNLRAICLPDASFLETKGSMAHLAGWGKFDQNGVESTYASSVLRETTVPYENGDFCTIVYGARGYTSPSYICGGGLKRGFLPGDSGAPLMSFKDGRWYATGIASVKMTNKLDRRAFPDIYIRVSAHCAWITRVTGVSCENYVQLPDIECKRVLYNRQLRKWKDLCGPSAKNKPEECAAPPMMANDQGF